VLVGAVAAIALASCSSDDGGDADQATDTATTLDAVDDTTPDVAPTTTFAVLPTRVTADDDEQGIGPPRPEEFGPAGMPTACLMASTEEIGEITGVTPVGGAEIEFRGVTTCWFRDAAEEKLVGIGITAADARVPPAAAFAELEAAPGATHVDGFGIDALWADSSLHVLHADALLSFEILPAVGVPDDQLQAVTEELATVALPRYAPPAE
jgi:hypothetical protein